MSDPVMRNPTNLKNNLKKRKRADPGIVNPTTAPFSSSRPQMTAPGQSSTGFYQYPFTPSGPAVLPSRPFVPGIGLLNEDGSWPDPEGSSQEEPPIIIIGQPTIIGNPPFPANPFQRPTNNTNDFNPIVLYPQPTIIIGKPPVIVQPPFPANPFQLIHPQTTTIYPPLIDPDSLPGNNRSGIPGAPLPKPDTSTPPSNNAGAGLGGFTPLSGINDCVRIVPCDNNNNNNNNECDCREPNPYDTDPNFALVGATNYVQGIGYVTPIGDSIMGNPAVSFNVGPNFYRPQGTFNSIDLDKNHGQTTIGLN